MKRYDINCDDCDGIEAQYVTMSEHEDGDYVLYSDAQAALAEKDAEIAKLKETSSFWAVARSRDKWKARAEEAEAVAFAAEAECRMHDDARVEAEARGPSREDIAEQVRRVLNEALFPDNVDAYVEDVMSSLFPEEPKA